MSQALTELMEANRKYSGEFGDKAHLAVPPARRFAILTCMDARLDPSKFAGLAEGDAHVIRNAGGRASDDAIRSLVISYKLLGTCEFFVYPSHRLWIDFFYKRRDASTAGGKPGTSGTNSQWLPRCGLRPGFTRGRYDRLVDDRRREASHHR